MSDETSADKVEVRQVDREAAADLAAMASHLSFGGNDAAAIRQGIWDNAQSEIGPFVQFVASIRATAEASARKIAFDALNDGVATLAAVRATASSDEWAESAEHFSSLCLETIQRMSAAIRALAEKD